jgi:hypothetical protein
MAHEIHMTRRSTLRQQIEYLTDKAANAAASIDALAFAQAAANAANAAHTLQMVEYTETHKK